MNYLDKYRQYLVLKCELYEKGKVSEEWNDIQEYFLMMSKPLVFNPYESENVLRSAERIFEEIVSTMQEQGITEPKKLSEFEFYSRLMYFEKKFKNGKSG